MPQDTPLRNRARYLLGAGVLVLVYAVAAPILWANRDFVDDGPLALNQPALEQPLPGGIPLAQSEAKVREAVSGASHSDPAGEAAALPPAQPTY